MSDKQRNVNVQSGTVTIATSDTTKAGTTTFTANGLAWFTGFTTPDMQSSNSTNLGVVMSPGGTIFSSGTKAESGTYQSGSQYPLYGTVSVVATSEGTESANRAVPYTIVYET